MSEQKKEGTVADGKNTNKIIVSIIVVVVVFLLGLIIGKNKTEDVPLEEEVLSEVVESEGTDDSLVASDGLIHPKAPGPWATGAVKNLMPNSFVVGENTLTANIKGLFVEGVGMVKIYDNLTEVFSSEINAMPESDWVNNFVEIEPVKVIIPESLKGKTLIVRFMAPDVSGEGEMKYFGQTVSVE